MLPETGARSTTLREPDIATLRRRLLVTRHLAVHGEGSAMPNCQGALVSLVFNRGASMKGDRRIEMRAIRNLAPQKDYAGIAQQFRKMKRLWIGTDIEKGMSRRRDAEADLVLKSKP